MPPTKQDQLRTQTLPLPFHTRLIPFLLQTLHIIIRNRISNHNASPYMNQQKSNYPHQTKSTTALQSHYHLMPSIYLTKELTSSPPLPLDTSISSLQETVTSKVNTALCSIIRKKNYTIRVNKSSNTTKTLRRFHPYNKQLHPLSLLHQEQSRPHFNLHFIDYVHNTVSFTS